MVIWWCVQARERGLLVGDLHTVGKQALMIAMGRERSDRHDSVSAVIREIDGVFDSWLAIEHNKAWNSLNAERQARELAEQEVEEGFDLSAPDMSSMLEMLRGMADVEGGGVAG